jgi:hypothetical protein
MDRADGGQLEVELAARVRTDQHVVDVLEDDASSVQRSPEDC